MKKMLVNKTFNEYWVDCQIKNCLTILTSIDSNYLILGAMNDYVYELDGRSGWLKVINVKYTERYYEFSNNIDTIRFTIDSSKIINEIIKYINDNRFIGVNVDLYYWNENSVLWHKKHNTHYSMAVGYDDEKEVIYFAEDVNSNGMFVVSYVKLMEAVKCNLDDTIPVIEYKLKEILIKRNITFEDVRFNSKQIISSIDMLKYSSYWEMFGKLDDLDLLVTESNRIYNRQLSNKILLDYLHDNKLIDECNFNERFNLLECIIEKWYLIRNLFVKLIIKFDSNKMEQINNLTEEALDFEKQFWSGFVNDTGEYEDKCAISTDVDVFIPTIEYRDLDNPLGLKKTICTLDRESNYYTDVILFFHHFHEERRHIKNYIFNIYSDSKYMKDTNFVENVIIDECNVLLKTKIPFTDIIGLDRFSLNIEKSEYHSEKGQLNVMEKVALFPVKKISPYISKCFVSQLFDFECEIDDASNPYDSGITYSMKYFPDYFCEFPTNIKNDVNQIVYFKYIFKCDKTSDVRLYIGHTGGVKIWSNNAHIATFRAKNHMPELNDVEFTRTCKFINGYNTVVVAAQTCYGKANRIKLRIEDISLNAQSFPCYIIETRK